MSRSLAALVNAPPNIAGQDTSNLNLSRKIISGQAEGADWGFGWNPLARNYEGLTLMALGSADGHAWQPTATTVASGQLVPTFPAGSIAYGNDGLVLTTGAISGQQVTIQGNRRYNTANLSKLVAGKFMFQAAQIVTQNLYFGIANTQAAPFTTPFTNGVWFNVANATLTGQVVGNSGTAAASATIATIASATVYEIGFQFWNTGVASSSWGYFWLGQGPSTLSKPPGTATVVAFTAAQLTQLIAMTGNIYGIANITTNAASAANMTIDAATIEIDR